MSLNPILITGEDRNTYLNEEYENFVNALLKTAAECIPTKELNLKSHGRH